MFNTATKRRLTLSKTTVRELNDFESGFVGGAKAKVITKQAPTPSITPTNPPPGGGGPGGTATTTTPYFQTLACPTAGACGSGPSICLCVPNPPLPPLQSQIPCGGTGVPGCGNVSENTRDRQCTQ
jgi:hypothetical protein